MSRAEGAMTLHDADQKRLGVLKAVWAGKMSRWEVAESLAVSERQGRRVLASV